MKYKRGTQYRLTQDTTSIFGSPFTKGEMVFLCESRDSTRDGTLLVSRKEDPKFKYLLYVQDLEKITLEGQAS